MHRCNKSGCRNLIPLDEKYCETHKGQEYLKERIELAKQQKLQSISKAYQYNKDRRTAYMHSARADELDVQWYQSQAWRRLSNQIHVRDLYTCRVCGHTQLPNESMVTDHIVPRRTASELAMTESNLWLLCRTCHNKKSGEERKRTAQQLKQMTKSEWIRLLK